MCCFLRNNLWVEGWINPLDGTASIYPSNKSAHLPAVLLCHVYSTIF